ncbi:MAG: phosphoenolpyruvate synthase [Clostridia bacterium]|nr:phosphoenolpyruvate synthase [Deltaproteobacteria bacterium]
MLSPVSATTVAQESAGEVAGVVGERLTTQAFAQLSGTLGGYPFVKIVIDRPSRTVHFLNNAKYPFHADYIGEQILGMHPGDIDREIDQYNETFYHARDRRFFLGILALHKDKQADRRFVTMETVEVDTMDSVMLRSFFEIVKDHLDPAMPLLLKPANHLQESIVSNIPREEMPRVYSHELFATSRFIALNPGDTRGRIRAFKTELEYRAAAHTIEWHDILVMHRVPDDIPRVSGIINAHHTTPLSHTNVLASGWAIPNCIRLGIFDRIDKERLDGHWVRYSVEMDGTDPLLEPVEKPEGVEKAPTWTIQRIKLEEPETVNTPIVALDKLRMSDRYRYGTKAANLGELKYILEHGSERMLGFYRVRRPPRANLLQYLARMLGVPPSFATEARGATLGRAAWDFLRETFQIPRGIAIPFAVQQEFLESSPRIQQAIGKLKMALELNAREIDPLCVSMQQMIRQARMPDRIRNAIDTQISEHLSGVSSFVVRSSSNAEDLQGFSAAGIYESVNKARTSEDVFDSIKEVWASVLSPRSVRLRNDVGISLDDTWMGVIVQEKVQSGMGGVLVTTNPMARDDFRNVYVNVSPKSVEDIVQGSELPLQYLYNVVEGGGRTLSIGDANEDLADERKDNLQKLALAGRLLQGHFSPDYTFAQPVDIEWLANDEGIFILQLRPYAK